MTENAKEILVLSDRKQANGKECHVVVPTHKESLIGYEEMALINNLKILQEWPLTICLPFGVSKDYYNKLTIEHNLEVSVINLPEGYLGTIEKYNKLLLSSVFYEMFVDSKYILITQVDVWIFRDELQFWIDKEYDYVGAPLFLPQNRESKKLENLMLPFGGNGGLSLRNVKKTLELTQTPKRRFCVGRVLIAMFFLIRYQNSNFLKIYLYSLNQLWHDPKAFREKHQIYEDVMFSVFYAIFSRDYRVAPARVSLGFSIEVHSSNYLDSFFQFTSPFGLHGYDKYLSSDQLDWIVKNSKLRSRSYAKSR